MNLENELKLYMNAYQGVKLMDEYPLKVYVLKDIEKLIDKIKNNYHVNIEYVEPVERVKLQDALIVLNMIDAPLELITLIKRKVLNLEERGK